MWLRIADTHFRCRTSASQPLRSSRASTRSTHTWDLVTVPSPTLRVSKPSACAAMRGCLTDRRGADTQFDVAAGIPARGWNIANGIFWAGLGLVFMEVSQLNVRHVMFRGTVSGPFLPVRYISYRKSKRVGTVDALWMSTSFALSFLGGQRRHRSPCRRWNHWRCGARPGSCCSIR